MTRQATARAPEPESNTLPQIVSWTERQPTRMPLMWHEEARLSTLKDVPHAVLLMIQPRVSGIPSERAGYLVSTRTHAVTVERNEPAVTYPYFSTQSVVIKPLPRGSAMKVVLECSCGRRTPDLSVAGQDIYSIREAAAKFAHGWSVAPTFCPDCQRSLSAGELVQTWLDRLTAYNGQGDPAGPGAGSVWVGVRSLFVAGDESYRDFEHGDINTAPFALRLEGE